MLRVVTEASGKQEKAGCFALDSLFPHCVRSDLHENFLSLFDLMVHMTT